MTWKIEPHDNYMSEDHGISEPPVQIVDDKGNVVACNTTFYPTAITAEHAATIVAAVNEVAELREQLATARAEIADYERVPHMTRATPDDLDRRASCATGWRRSVLQKLAAEARAYRGEPTEVVTTYRRAA